MAWPHYGFTCHGGFDDLPKDAADMFSRQWSKDYFLTPRWYDYVVSHFIQDRREFCLWLARAADGTPAMLFPARRTTMDPKAKGALCLQSASHWENAAPMGLFFNPEAGDPEEVLTEFGLFLRARQENGDGPYDVLRFWPLDPTSDLAQTLPNALARAGFKMQAYKNSINQYEIIEGKDFDTYFAERSYSFRYSLRRKRRKLEREHVVTFDYYTSPDNLDEGLSDYEAISLASWKQPFTMVGPVFFNLIRDAMEAGVGLLSIMKLDGKPVSTQFWIISGGVGEIVRLAYDKAYEKQAVGIVHNEEMIRKVMSENELDELSYGYGAEEAKAKWTPRKRTLYGIMAFNPQTRRGRLAAFRNITGSKIKQKLVMPVWGPISGRLGRK